MTKFVDDENKETFEEKGIASIKIDLIQECNPPKYNITITYSDKSTKPFTEIEKEELAEYDSNYFDDGDRKILFDHVESLLDDNTIPPAIAAKSFQYSMPILGGFIAALGVAAVAVAFTALSAASLGIVGLAVAAIGAAATLAGVGLFAVSSLRQCRLAPEPTISDMALSN